MKIHCLLAILVPLAHLVLSASEAVPKVFFLMLIENKIYNVPVWDLFFKNVPKDKYSFLVHAFSGVARNALIGDIDITIVPKVANKYCDLTLIMKALAQKALTLSAHPGDGFVYLSSDSLPIKPFNAVYTHFTNKKESAVCISSTDQWHHDSHYQYYAPKHHQWIALTRPDAQKVASDMTQTTNQLLNPAIPCSGTSCCTEEVYFYTKIYGPFDKTRSNLTFPSTKEQGECVMYVHWPEYPADSVFRHNLPQLPFENQMLTKVHGHFYQKLRDTTGFYFARKIRSDDGTSVVLHRKDAGTAAAAATASATAGGAEEEVVSVFDFFRTTRFYDEL